MYKFVFDLDSTITKDELIPLVAKKFGLYEKILTMTQNAMQGLESFEQNFRSRIDMLKGISIDDIHDITKKAHLNTYITRFIKENNDRCIIVTGNLYEVVFPILEYLNMENRCYSCIARIEDNKLIGVKEVINKKDIVSNFDFPFVAIGDGANDIDMLNIADIGIAFGNKNNLPKELVKVANHIFEDDKKLYEFLNTLL